MNKVNFSSEYYKNIAMRMVRSDDKVISSTDALFLLLIGTEYKDLSNLCDLIRRRFSFLNFSKEGCYKKLQNTNINDEYKKIVIECVYECLNSRLYLDNNCINNNFNNGKIILVLGLVIRYILVKYVLI